MNVALIVAIAGVSILATMAAAWRLWVSARRGAPRDLQVGYLAIMVSTGVISLLLLRYL